MADHTRLQKFVEAALTNPRHPVYRMGLSHSPILQNYAVNVSLLKAVKPEKWFEQNPDLAAKLNEVMKLCEQDDPAAPQSEIDALKARVAELEAKKAKDGNAAPPPLAHAETPPPEGE